MASTKAKAITVQIAHERLKNAVPVLVERFQVDAPNMNIPKRYKPDYIRALELDRVSKFIDALAHADIAPPQDDRLQAAIKLVSQPMTKWTKQEVKDLLGGI